MLLTLILLPLAGAFAAYCAGRRVDRARGVLLRLVSLTEFLLALFMLLGGREYALTLPKVCGLGLTFRADGFRRLYLVVATFLWVMTSAFSAEYFLHYQNKNRYVFFNLLTLSAVMGLFASDDLYTTFVFFEIMSMASYPWVAHDENGGAMRAAATYMGISVFGGMVTLMGLFMLYTRIGSLSFDALRAAAGDGALTVPAVLALFGFAVKAGAFPVHVWLPKAHPVAPAPASALLSGILTKTGVFGILAISMNLFSGVRAFGDVLLVVALTTMLLGAVLGVFSTNLKRTLACSSMSQIGYILTGVSTSLLLGHHGSLAAAGAVTHMVNHSLLKLVLFLCAGCVYMNLHRLELNDIRGFGRGKPLLNLCFLMGALGLMGVPLFNGYVSKTMIHEALVELGGAYRLHEYIFLFAAGLTTAYMLKLYIALFIQKNPDRKLQAKYDALNGRYMTRRSAVAVGVPALLIPLLGILPGQTLMKAAQLSAPFLNREPSERIAFFSLNNLKGGAITLAIGTLVYVLVVRRWMMKDGGYLNRWPEKLDLENAVYRPALCRALPNALCAVSSLLDGLVDSKFVRKGLGGTATALLRLLDGFTDSKFVRKGLGGGATALLRLLDGFTDSKFVRVTLANAAVAVLRAMNELLDHIALLFREMLFSTRSDLRRTKHESPIIRVVSACADGIYAVFYRFKPKRKPDAVVTDMRYGTFVTNAVSFGMLLTAVAVVAAILYVFSKI